MCTSLKMLVIAAVSMFPFCAGAAPEETAAKPVNSKITEVTVYADRSRVTRVAQAELPAGVACLVFEKLPGWIDEGSVRVALKPAAAGKIADVQVLRTFLAQPADDEVRKLEEGITEIQDQLAALDDELGPLEAQERQITSIRTFTTEKWTKETVVREVKLEEYGGMVKFIGNSLAEIAKKRREIMKKKRVFQPELAVRQRKLADLRQCMQLEQRTVIVSIVTEKPVPAEVALTYMLPGTTWEPVHELRATLDGKTVEIASYAVVSQTTGENWDCANLTFSTQRPTATARIPELEALMIGEARTAKMLNGGRDDSFQAAQKNWTMQNSSFNGVVLTGNNTYTGSTLVNGGTLQLSQSAYLDNVGQQQLVQTKVATLFEKIQQQRGTTAQFAALGPQTVRTDGRQVRVPVGTMRMDAVQKIVAAPELSLNAVRTVDLTNAGTQPLLPGKVSLFLDGALVGTTEVEFTGTGEGFSMFLGTVDSFKLSRTLDKKSSSLTWTGKRKKMQVSFLVMVENLADRPATFQLADRIPVSDNDDVRVSGVTITPEVKPDVKGLLKWEATLAAKEKKQFRIEYTLVYPPELPVVARKSQADGEAAPAAGLRMQILDLESKF